MKITKTKEKTIIEMSPSDKRVAQQLISLGNSTDGDYEEIYRFLMALASGTIPNNLKWKYELRVTPWAKPSY